MIRPVHLADQAALAALIEAAAPALRLRDPEATASAWTAKPSGADHHLLGLWRDGALVAAAHVSLAQRLRNRHCAELELASRPDVEVQALVESVLTLLDDWSAVDRLDIELPDDHEALPTLRRLGFVDEVRRVARMMGGRDNLILGRLRPGFVPRPSAGPPAWPRRAREAGLEVTIRPLAEADAAGVQALSTTPGSVWGTLQTSSSNDWFYIKRFQSTPPGNQLVVVEVGEAIAGIGGLHPTGEPDVVVLGMGFHDDWQGMGLGKRLMEALLQMAAERGARRVELSVWQDNTRARALYERFGFKPEGLRRFDGLRSGGHASSLDMALFLGNGP